MKTNEEIIEIINSDEFKQAIENKIKELIHHRDKRPEAGPGRRYVRDWFNRLKDNGNLVSSFFINNYPDILDKKSHLSSEMRHVIRYVCEPILLAIILSKHDEL